MDAAYDAQDIREHCESLALTVDQLLRLAG
jgi:hypothetical protein